MTKLSEIKRDFILYKSKSMEIFDFKMFKFKVLPYYLRKFYFNLMATTIEDK
jgi:hypothetical protein